MAISKSSDGVIKELLVRREKIEAALRYLTEIDIETGLCKNPA